jgi:two-component system response regulator (stage 0 sporulation protein F)
MRRSVVLVVDDDADIRECITSLLEAEGYATRQAANGLQALDVLEDGAPRLVLLDMRMPVMDGREFLHAFEDRGHDVPVIVLTAHSEGMERTLMRRVLRKPLNVDELVEAVREVCEPEDADAGWPEEARTQRMPTVFHRD